MRLDGLGADVQPKRDLLGGIALGKKLQHLPLSSRQEREGGRCGVVLHAQQVGHECRANRGTYVRLSISHGADRTNQFGKITPLEKISGCPGAEHLGDVFERRVHGQSDDFHGWRFLMNLPRGFDAVEVRHRDVHHDD